ncbi:MAG: GNAT family N-acetyltransferase [Thermoplasmatota archaeon]
MEWSKAHPDIKIRKAVPKDAAKLADFRVGFLNEFFEHPADEESERLRENIALYYREHLDKGDFIALICEKDKKLIASIGMIIRTMPPVYGNLMNGKLGYLLNIHTLPAYHGMGITGELTRIMVQEARELDLGYIHLHTGLDAVRIYQKMGFKEVTATELRMDLK